MYKVIIKDNLDRESVSDRLFKENLTKVEAEDLADKMNLPLEACEFCNDYYKAVPMEYKLWDSSVLY